MMYDLVRQQEQRELDANAEAVRILMRAQGLDERAAVRQLHTWLWRLRERPAVPNHLSSCAEIDDLMRRFPAVALRSCLAGL